MLRYTFVSRVVHFGIGLQMSDRYIVFSAHELLQLGGSTKQCEEVRRNNRVQSVAHGRPLRCSLAQEALHKGHRPALTILVSQLLVHTSAGLDRHQVAENVQVRPAERAVGRLQCSELLSALVTPLGDHVQLVGAHFTQQVVLLRALVVAHEALPGQRRPAQAQHRAAADGGAHQLADHAVEREVVVRGAGRIGDPALVRAVVAGHEERKTEVGRAVQLADQQPEHLLVDATLVDGGQVFEVDAERLLESQRLDPLLRRGERSLESAQQKVLELGGRRMRRDVLLVCLLHQREIELQRDAPHATAPATPGGRRSGLVAVAVSVAQSVQSGAQQREAAGRQQMADRLDEARGELVLVQRTQAIGQRKMEAQQKQ
mmetsp:Transcript_27516/g.69021  ORF Transcript_27516/g.69021 Transcript_27516/m.69021 type:complete len:373 (-) Transcript_27516:1597-2715(-)